MQSQWSTLRPASKSLVQCAQPSPSRSAARIVGRRLQGGEDGRLREAKLAKLIEIEGYDSADELLEAVFSDSVSPAICMNEACDFTCEMEPDQDAGYCEACGKNSVASALVLAGLI